MFLVVVVVVMVAFHDKACVCAAAESHPVPYYFVFIMSSRPCQAPVLFADLTSGFLECSSIEKFIEFAS